MTTNISGPLYQIAAANINEDACNNTFYRVACSANDGLLVRVPTELSATVLDRVEELIGDVFLYETDADLTEGKTLFLIVKPSAVTIMQGGTNGDAKLLSSRYKELHIAELFRLPKPPVLVETGKVYLRADKTLAYAISANTLDCIDGTWSYTNDGRYCGHERDEAYPKHLVAEFEQDQTIRVVDNSGSYVKLPAIHAYCVMNALGGRHRANTQVEAVEEE